ncbi:uncharacterized protein FIBRA_06705 [Fibroporia radiculosa]|uniref:Fatty acid desaturase domain-containing protein n=1 Tax=Fibroporia radiculosa TaxID=599839 RepID=J4H479_9APHY|nr:uncharacterized protein FIBRA_06705 [Fibroporia radiculosa]CCM04524.1 predicted protein [Fibroporia radiculosa]
MAAALWTLAFHIDPTFRSERIVRALTHPGAETARRVAWLVYWWFQGLTFTGVWVVGHECGHGAFSPNRRICDIIGFITHTLLWTPYFSWQISHHRHHRNHASMERDEVYVPKTRSDLGIPKEGHGAIDYEEYLGDTPIYTLFMLLRQQIFAFPAYLLFNVSGQKGYPKWTNHFDRKASFFGSAGVLTSQFAADSILFTKRQRNVVLISNAGIMAMLWIVSQSVQRWGALTVIKFYGIPWLLVSHWFIMITYLHHTDTELPHYRNAQWNFQRGAAATVDRDFLGWQGRFFLHDVAHFHVIHHFFPMMPFYNGPEATKYLKEFIGEHYRLSNKPVFKALWDTYNECQFVEDEGDIVFYRNRKGQAKIRPAAPYRRSSAVEDLPQH